eukprot:Ihof_evm16s54 gene=Ihof_evmTU16s54
MVGSKKKPGAQEKEKPTNHNQKTTETCPFESLKTTSLDQAITHTKEDTQNTKDSNKRECKSSYISILHSIPYSRCLTYIAIAMAVCYLWVVGRNMYDIFNPIHVNASTPGHTNIYSIGQPLDLYVYASTRQKYCQSSKERKHCKLVMKEFNISYGFYNDTISKDIVIPAPYIKSTRPTKPLYLHVWFTKSGTKPPQEAIKQDAVPFDYDNVIAGSGPIVTMMKVKQKAVNLLEGKSEPIEDESTQKEKMHITTEVNFALVVDETRYPINQFPPDYGHLMRTSQGRYFPMVFYNEFMLSQKNYVVLNQTIGAKDSNVTVKISFNSIGSFRLYNQMAIVKSVLHEQYGLSDHDLDAIRDLLFNNTPTILAITLFVTIIHILFDFLSFKNDIGYWKKRKTMQGLSTRSLVLSAVTQGVVTLYLWDNDSSLLITVPAGIQAVIDLWKVKKAFKIEIIWLYQVIPVGYTSGTRVGSDESITEEADIVATKYMTYALYPLMIGYSIYSLVYSKHKGVFSWILSTLTGYIYAFGFVMMTPQLFINYRLKSVAHLPWRALCYKFFNTFIDDVFAFIIHMPTMHRLACFRDDAIFICFLYQLYIYPVDSTRVNEYGFSKDDMITEQSE